MNLEIKKDFWVENIFKYFTDKTTKEVENLVFDSGNESGAIYDDLRKKYPDDFILIDLKQINQGNIHKYHIRIIGEKEKPELDERGIPFCSCGKPATWNMQENWVVWEISKSGFYERFGEENTGENLFYCDECAEKEGYI